MRYLALRPVMGVALRYLAPRPVMGVALRYLAPRPVMGVVLPHAAPVQGVSRPPHTASRDCRNGSPLARAIPCAPAPECGVTREKEQAGQRCNEEQKHPAFLPAHPHAAQRAVPGWRGGLGRVGADLASAGSMRPPPSPARHVSTAWLATTHASRETARNHTRQPRNSTPPPKPSKQRQYIATRHHTSQARNGSPPQTPAQQRQHVAARHHKSQPRTARQPWKKKL